MTTTEEDGTKENTFIDNVSGYKLFCRYWNKSITETKSTYRALVFICHGLAEHSGRYEKVANQLVEERFFVFSHDHVGHGQSEGPRADVRNFEDYSSDVISHIQLVKKKYADCPVFILGHSLGGLITVNTTMVEPHLIQGTVLIAPSLHLDIQGWKVCAGTAIAKLFPQLGISPPLSTSLFCRDEEIVKDYINDPLVYHGWVKARWGTCFYKSLSAFDDHMSDFKCPVLILHGDKDGICDIVGSEKLHVEAASTDKSMKVYAGAYHQLHNEPDGVAEDVMQEIIKWINERI